LAHTKGTISDKIGNNSGTESAQYNQFKNITFNGSTIKVGIKNASAKDSFCLTQRDELLKVVNIFQNREDCSFTLQGEINNKKHSLFLERCNSELLSIFVFQASESSILKLVPLTEIKFKCQVFVNNEALIAIPLLHHL